MKPPMMSRGNRAEPLRRRAGCLITAPSWKQRRRQRSAGSRTTWRAASPSRGGSTTCGQAGKIAFITLRDGSGLCQCVLEKTPESEATFNEVRHLGQESAVEVTGVVSADERSVGGFELKVSHANIIHETTGYPITPKAHGIEFLMERRHLWFRSMRQWHILRVRATIIDEIRRYYNDNGYVLIDTPIFAPAAGEGRADALSRRLLRRAGVPRPDRAALRRSRVHGARQGILLRADLSRGEEQDPPAPHRVLDGRAGNRVRLEPRPR